MQSFSFLLFRDYLKKCKFLEICQIFGIFRNMRVFINFTRNIYDKEPYNGFYYWYGVQVYFIISGILCILGNLYIIVLFLKFKKLREHLCNWLIFYLCIPALYAAPRASGIFIFQRTVGNLRRRLLEVSIIFWYKAQNSFAARIELGLYGRKFLHAVK